MIHIGANRAQEAKSYHEKFGSNVVWFEAMPKYAVHCQKNVRPYGQTCIEALLSNVSGVLVNFTTTSNDGASSSVHKFKEVTKHFPNVKETGTIPLETQTFEEIVREKPSIMSNKTHLVVDVQGHEYEVLEGMGEHLRGFDKAVVECSNIEMYEGQRLQRDVVALMAENGYKCIKNCNCVHCDTEFVPTTVA